MTGPSAVVTTGPVLLPAVMGAQAVAASSKPHKMDVVLTAVSSFYSEVKRGTQEAQEAQERSPLILFRIAWKEFLPETFFYE